MADNQTTPAPALTDEAKLRALRADAIKAWHEADSEDKRRAAVKQFPVLRAMYSEAQNF